MVANDANGKGVVLANGAEGEPLSTKDRTLMASRPHLVIDGALLAANAIGADDIIFYVGIDHRAAEAAMRRALAERSAELRGRARLVQAPRGYVAGEESAAVHFIDAGDPRPTTTPPRPSEAARSRLKRRPLAEALRAPTTATIALSSSSARPSTVRIGGASSIAASALG